MMKLRLVLGGFVLGAASALLTAHAMSQDAGGMPSPEEMQKRMTEYMASLEPGPHHRMLDTSVGTWDVVMKMWWEGPGTEPVETTGTATRKWILGGRFVQEELESEMMMPDMATGEMKPLPWRGLGLFGYDNGRHLFVGAWLDSMSTQILTMKGSADPSGTVFTYYGEMDEPMLGVVGRIVKYRTTVVNEDKQVFEIIDLHAGDDYKVVEVTYERRK